METEGYWALFWKTGLPAAWLLSRLWRRGESAAAFVPEEDGRGRV